MKMKILNHSIIALFVGSILLLSCSENVPPTDSETKMEKTEVDQKEGASSYTELTLTDGLYNIDASESTCIWTGKEASSKNHVGTINYHKGTIKVIDSKFHSAFCGIDMQSIQCTDMNADKAERLNGHLKSEDFFGVEKHPYATLNIESIKTKGGTSMAIGKLTIKGITEAVAFPLTLSGDSNTIVVDGTLVFDRSKFDVRFRSGNWFADLGDELIYDDIELEFHVVARM